MAERKHADEDDMDDFGGGGAAAAAEVSGPGNSAALAVALRRMRALASAVDVASLYDDAGGAGSNLPAALDSILQV